MKKISINITRIVVFGLLISTISLIWPYVSAFFSLYPENYSFVIGLMDLVIVFIFLTFYFKKIKSDYVRNGFVVGFTWFAIKFGLNVLYQMTPFLLPFRYYYDSDSSLSLPQIGLNYWLIPFISILFGFFVQRKHFFEQEINNNGRNNESAPTKSHDNEINSGFFKYTPTFARLSFIIKRSSITRSIIPNRTVFFIGVAILAIAIFYPDILLIPFLLPFNILINLFWPLGLGDLVGITPYDVGAYCYYGICVPASPVAWFFTLLFTSVFYYSIYRLFKYFYKKI